MGKVIAIDGPSGAGKSTIARMLAERLGYVYLDTGALYRAVALLFLRKSIGAEDDDAILADALTSSKVEFRDGKVFLNGQDVSREIRTPEVGHYSSVFSARKVVRDFLLDVQRSASRNQNLVVEGRDTTTVVFPRADKKFYMDASMSERAKRRYRQLAEMGLAVSEEKADRDIEERDRRDQNRNIAPLVRAEDALLLDTTDKSIEQVLEYVIGVIEKDRHE